MEDDNDIEDDNEGQEAIDESNRTKLAKLLEKWITQYQEIVVSPQTLGKISTRFYYALNAIDASDDIYTLGEIMHRYLVAFMNAVLIEDVRENTEKVSLLNLDNAVTVDNNFIDNLNKIKEENIFEDKLRFSKWIFSCPLILVYLEEKLISKIHDSIKIAEYVDVKSLSIHGRLCDILKNLEGKEISFIEKNFKIVIILLQQSEGISKEELEGKNEAELKGILQNSKLKDSKLKLFKKIEIPTVRKFYDYLHTEQPTETQS